MVHTWGPKGFPYTYFKATYTPYSYMDPLGKCMFGSGPFSSHPLATQLGLGVQRLLRLWFRVEGSVASGLVVFLREVALQFCNVCKGTRSTGA